MKEGAFIPVEFLKNGNIKVDTVTSDAKLSKSYEEIGDISGKNAEFLGKNLELKRKLEHDNMVPSLYNKIGFDENAKIKISEYKKICDDKGETGYFCVAFLDADFFKKINDKYGHDVGDLVIKEMGRALYAASRKSKDSRTPNDILAVDSRVGGDEFLAALIPEAGKVFTEAEALEMYKGWLARMNKLLESGVTITHKGKMLTIVPSLSSGYAIGNTIDKFELEELKKEADHSMFAAKRAKKGWLRRHAPILFAR